MVAFERHKFFDGQVWRNRTFRQDRRLVLELATDLARLEINSQGWRTKIHRLAAQ